MDGLKNPLYPYFEVTTIHPKKLSFKTSQIICATCSYRANVSTDVLNATKKCSNKNCSKLFCVNSKVHKCMEESLFVQSNSKVSREKLIVDDKDDEDSTSWRTMTMIAIVTKMRRMMKIRMSLNSVMPKRCTPTPGSC